MKTKHIIFAICMIVFSTCLCRSAYAQVKKDYKSLWTKVDSLKAASRPQSVIAEVNKIYDKAKSEGNSEQKIKALLVLFNASKEIEEDAIPVFIHRFESELKDATEIEKAFLHSYLANMYKTYLDQNQWEIYERTVVEGGESGALESWDARKFENAIEEHYRLSIENVSLLANLKVQQYPVLIESPVKTILYRPTVLDALAQEALQYFKETHSFSTKPEPLSDVDDSTLFMPFDQFRNFNVENSQLENRIKWCLRIYQKLGAHLSDKGYEDAFLKTELDRIEFVYSQYTGVKRDSLYLNALDYLNGKAVKSQVGGDILLAKAHYYLERGDTFNANDPKTKVYQKDNKKAYAIYKEIEARYVGTSPAAEAYNCLKRLEQKDLSVKTEPNILPTESFPIHVSFKNIKNVTCRIYKVSSEFARYEKDRNAEVEKLIYKLRDSGQLVLTEQFELPEDGDLNTHTTELTLKGLPLGHYYLVFSSETSGRISKKPVALSAITVSGIGYTKLYNDQGVNVVVFDRQTGEALSGVKAQVWYKEWNFDLKKYQEVRGELLMSDQNGKILVIKRKGVQCFLELMNGADHSLTEKIYVPWFVAPENRAQEKTFFFTDRAIYKPGQTIYFKGIMLKQIKGSGEPIVQRTSQVVLYDANLRAIDSLKVISNKYGSFSGSYRLPDNILNGSFSIRNGPDYHSIQVEAYRQPSFEVKLKNPSEQYVLNKSVSVNGTVNAYHGGTISGAKVRYQIVRESLWRPLKRYNFTSVRIASGELVTDTTGKFVLSFPLKSDKSFIDDPEEIYQFRIEVQVTDVSGETRSTSSVLDATRKALEFQVSYPECLTKERMANTPVYTILENSQGTKVSANYKVVLYQLTPKAFGLKSCLWEKADRPLLSREQWYKLIPTYAYADDADPKKWKQTLIKEYNLNTVKDTAFKFSELKKLNSGKYLIYFQTTDSFGNSIEHAHFFDLIDSKEKKSSLPDEFTCEIDKTVFTPGEKASIWIGSSRSASGWMYVECNRKTISFQRIYTNGILNALEIPVLEDYRGGFTIHLMLTSSNRTITKKFYINVPYRNELKIQPGKIAEVYKPGDKGQWSFMITDQDGKPVNSEVTAVLYDASLDQFAVNAWSFDPEVYNASGTGILYDVDQMEDSKCWRDFPKWINAGIIDFPSLKWFDNGMALGRGYKGELRIRGVSSLSRSKGVEVSDLEEFMTVEASNKMKFVPPVLKADEQVKEESTGNKEKQEKLIQNVQTRKNFSETAFFYPHLLTDAQGKVTIDYTLPESLTRWKLMILAHTQDMKHGFLTQQIVTRKNLMLQAFFPRIVREGDELEFSSRLSNVMEQKMSGMATLEISDGITGRLLEVKTVPQNFELDRSENKSLSWKVIIPSGTTILKCSLKAIVGNDQDGEERLIPVFSNSQAVTTTTPLLFLPGTTSKLPVADLIQKGNKAEKIILELTSNPGWYAVESMRIKKSTEMSCAECVFSDLFIRALTRKVLDTNPAINDFVTRGYQDGLKYEPSPLEKEPDLKQFALEQTPWIDDAKSDRFSYFDPKELTPSIVSGLNRLKELQLSDGGWPWYKGMRSNAYVTAYILSGLARLEKDGALNMRSYPDIKEAMFKGLGLLMNEMKSDFERIRNREQNNLTSFSILSLYTYSYFRDWNIPEKCKPAYEYYLNQSAKYWKECSLEQEGMLALALNRLGKKEAAQNILTSIREHALIKGSGMYWATNRKNWFSSNIDVQALMIETFDELAKDQKAIDQMTYWLLEQKRTQAWNTSKETASALSALLCRGKVVSESRPLRVTIKGKEVSPDLFIGKPGYLKMEVKSSDLKSIEITNPNSTQAWGGVYVMQKVPMTQNAEHGTDIRLKKELFLVQSANESVMVPLNDSLKLMPGDRVRVRLIIQSGRDLEFVSLLDPRGAGFEPASQLSEYRWKSGIGYYFTQTDTDTQFFLSDVSVGTHVLEYDLIVAHKGTFSTGLARIECMYAPEFSSYSGGSLLKTN